MLKTKLKIAEEVHNKIIERLVVQEIDEIYYRNQAKKLKYGKAKINKSQKSLEQEQLQIETKELLLVIKNYIKNIKK